ncbi:MAG TPA: SDR family oxidoreductase [Solirubrobacterales bacterium]|jgi:NAD(P)-dependent dehydrogenase (short-subunit alcohol dehydrogenase family)
MTDLDGRVIAIAGAGGGLGPVVAQRLADAGASLCLADRSQETADQVADSLNLPDDRVFPHAVDLLDESQANDWAGTTVQKFGHVDGLLHLVGGYRGGDPIDSFDLADYDFLHGLLVRTLQLTTRAFHSSLTTSDHGRFVLVSAAAAQMPENTNAAYASAKAAAEAWTLALADSFSGTTATANIIVVNAIETPQIRDSSPGMQRPTFTPAEDLADAIAFLCSDSAARMNGQRLSLHP